FPLDAKTVRAIGRALGDHLPQKLKRAVIGQDTRESSAWIADTVTSGLVEAGVEVESAGVVTTPDKWEVIMSKVNCVTQVWFLLLVTLRSAPWSPSQAASQGHALTLPAGKDSVVRFFYQPPEGEYFHFPLVFRVVNEKDPRLNTAPPLDTGRTAYISISEMQR